MTVDKDKLRQLAEAATPWAASVSPLSDAQMAIMYDYRRAANPATVLALLDELAAMTKARDEACNWLMESVAPSIDTERRISALRKVGTHD